MSDQLQFNTPRNEGTPFYAGLRVKVIQCADETCEEENVGKEGTVQSLTYPKDIGASFPYDPFIHVKLDDGTYESFWKEELKVL